MSMSNYDLLCQLSTEVYCAREKFPKTDDMFYALAEEVGELGQALIQQKHEPEKGVSHEDIFQEALQVAAVALRIASEGITGFPYHPESGYRGEGWVGYQEVSQQEPDDGD